MYLNLLAYRGFAKNIMIVDMMWYQLVDVETFVVRAPEFPFDSISQQHIDDLN